MTGAAEPDSRYFNPRSSCEERRSCMISSAGTARFQSTLLMRGATIARPYNLEDIIFQSTLLMRGATHRGWSAKAVSRDGDISIHAPHARSDKTLMA